MAVPVIMPRQGQSVESCIIAKWHKKIGDRVEIGDMLFSYETDKASFDEEAKVAGTMLNIFFEEGDDVPCLINVCVIGNADESSAEFNPNGLKTAVSLVSMDQPGAHQSERDKTIQTTDHSASPNASQGAVVQSDTAAMGSGNDGMVKISPRARKIAERFGVDFRYASPSGPNGRIIERDLSALRESGLLFTPAALEEQLSDGEAAGQSQWATGRGLDATTVHTGSGLGGRITTSDLKSGFFVERKGDAAVSAAEVLDQPYDEIKMPNIRKVIARTMHQSLSTMAQLTLNASFDITEILEFRKKLKEGKTSLSPVNITINDIVIYVISRTLPDHKSLNAHFLDDRLLCYKNTNIGVAVDTERGLMVPTLFNANLMSLEEISTEVKKLVKDCQAGTINPDKLKNGTFTVTNLGTLDVESFTPVINPPQTGILGVNNIMQRAREIDGKIEFYPAMGLSLTFDHRALDGAPAARFLKELKTGLENFSVLLAKS